MSKCLMVKSPLNGRNMPSKLFPLLENKFGNEAEAMYDYVYSASFLNYFGDWTKQTKDNRIDNTYFTGEPDISVVEKEYFSDRLLAIETSKEASQKLRDKILGSDTSLDTFKVEEAKDAIFYFASEKFFESYKANKESVNIKECFDYAREELTKLKENSSEERIANIDAVLSEYGKLLPLVADKFKQLGIKVTIPKITIGDTSKEFSVLSIEGVEENEEVDNESIENENDYTSEIGTVGIDNAWAVSSFSIDPVSTASVDLKIRLSRLSSYDKNGKQEFTYLKTPKLIDLDTVYISMLRMVENNPDLTEETFLDILEKSGQGWAKELKIQFQKPNQKILSMPKADLVNIIMKKFGKDEIAATKEAEARIAQEKNKYSQSEKNKLITGIKKSKATFYLTLWNRNKNGIVESQIINSNSQSTDQIILDTWYENFKNTEYVEFQNGKLVTKNTDEIYNKYVEVTKIKEEDRKIEALTELLAEIGIITSLKSIENILNGGYVTKDKVAKHRYLASERNFDYLKDDIISLKPKSYFNKIFSAFKKNNNSEEGIKNNPFEGSDAVGTFIKEALIKAHKETSEVLFSDSHKDINGNMVYAYSQPKMIDNTFNRIERGDSEEAIKLIESPFAKDNGEYSEFTNNIRMGKIKLGYDEGMKKRDDDKGVDQVKASDKEIALHKLLQILNSGGQYRFVIGTTISDKGRFAKLRVPKIDLTFDEKLGSSQNMQLLYNLVNAETRRIKSFTNSNTENKDYNNSGKLYHFFPLINKEVLLQSGLAEVLGYKEEDYDSDGTIRNQDLLENIVNHTLKDSIQKRLQLWKDIKLIEKVEVKNKKIKGLNLDAKWLKENKFFVSNLEGGKLAINQNEINKAYNQAALEYEFYHFYVLGEYYRNVGGDPANAIKGKGTEGNIRSTIEKTQIELIKRNAKDIAPGNELNWNIANDEGEFYENKNYNYAIINDNNNIAAITKNEYIANHPVLGNLYKEIERTDAQEYATGVEFLDSLFAKGEIEDERYIALRKKLRSQELNGVNDSNVLNKYELAELILQPQKSVYVGDKALNNGYLSKVYLKSSTFPLIPQLTQGLEIDRLLQKMISQNVQRVGFKSAAKLGRINVTSIYEESGEMMQDFELKPFSLSRTGFRIQQEVPYDAKKAEIVFVSQMDKLITGDILNLSNFNLNGVEYTGQQIREQKESLRIKIFELAKEELFKKLALELVEDENGNLVANFKDKSKLEAFIKEEANSSTKLNINDEMSIYLRKDGQFEIPLFFNNSANKFESLLTSVVSKVVLNKISGKSYVQTTANSWMTGDTEMLNKSGIKFVNNPDFDISKGLQTMRIVDKATRQPAIGITSDDFINSSEEKRKELLSKYEVLPAQVVVPFKFRDNEGNLLKLDDFLNEKSQIDYNKLPREVLRLIGARIPNQGHNSQLLIEIVGFLPIKSDAIIVPVEITRQMGSDRIMSP